MKKGNHLNSVKTILGLFLIAGTICSSYAASNYSYTAPVTPAYNNSNSLQGRVTYVPAGVTTTVMLTSPLNSETSLVGTPVSATLVNDFIHNGKTIAQKGSLINGTIVKSKKAGLGNKNGQIQVIFNSMTTPQGYNIPINAVFKTDDNSGILKGGTKMDGAKDYAKNTVLGAGAGAALGTAMGALAGGSVGKGAIYGTAIGGGLGVAKGISNRGDNVNIPSSSYLDIYFTQPVTLSAPEEYRYDY